MAEPSSTFATDLVEALGELGEIVKDETADTGSFSYTYASLGAVMRSVRPVLARHHLALAQEISTDDDTVSVVTKILHVSGESYRSSPISMRFKPDPQNLGSIVTYLRRYQALAELGLAVEDDDGKLASQAARQQSQPPPRRRSPAKTSPPADLDAELADLFARLGMAGDDCRPGRLALIGDILEREVATTSRLPDEDKRRLIAALIARLEASTS